MDKMLFNLFYKITIRKSIYYIINIFKNNIIMYLIKYNIIAEIF